MINIKEGDKNIGFLARWTDLYFTYGLIAGNGDISLGTRERMRLILV